jgi:hypothetical protein
MHVVLSSALRDAGTPVAMPLLDQPMQTLVQRLVHDAGWVQEQEPLHAAYELVRRVAKVRLGRLARWDLFSQGSEKRVQRANVIATVTARQRRSRGHSPFSSHGAPYRTEQVVRAAERSVCVR